MLTLKRFSPAYLSEEQGCRGVPCGAKMMSGLLWSERLHLSN